MFIDKKFLVAGGILLVVVAFIVSLFVFFSPEFPESVPSSENISVREENYREQSQFFSRITRYLRDNHGGIIEAEEIDKNISVEGEKSFSYLLYRHRYKFIDENLLVKLVRNFAKSEGISYKLKRYTYKNKELNRPDSYEAVFYKSDDPWVSLKMEWADESRFQQKPRIQYTESTESSKKDLEEPVVVPNSVVRLVIIIDDLGNNMEVFRKLIQLDYDITYSILPQLAFSQETAEIVNQAGHDIILHLPMQPKDWPRYNPGIGALMINDDSETIQSKMESNLSSVPYVIGVNNHMGSAFTQHSQGLNILMKILRDRNLFFVDSKTAPGNTARSIARQNQVAYISRNIFLDNVQDLAYVEGQLNKAAKLAKRLGSAIAIGHPYQVTYRGLKNLLPQLEKQQIRIAPVSELLRH